MRYPPLWHCLVQQDWFVQGRQRNGESFIYGETRSRRFARIQTVPHKCNCFDGDSYGYRDNSPESKRYATTSVESSLTMDLKVVPATASQGGSEGFTLSSSERVSEGVVPGTVPSVSPSPVQPATATVRASTVPQRNPRP
jgi:hypothetical protein